MKEESRKRAEETVRLQFKPNRILHGWWDARKKKSVYWDAMSLKARDSMSKKERRRLLKQRTITIMRPRVFDAVIVTNPYAFHGVI